MEIANLDIEQARSLEWLVKNILGFGNALGVVLDAGKVKTALVDLVNDAEK